MRNGFAKDLTVAAVQKTKAPVIYAITNTVTGKQYVGQTRCGLAERWTRHWRRAEINKGGCHAIGAAIRKYGKDVFTIEAVVELSVNSCQIDIDLAEQETIGRLNTLSPSGYNLTAGGSCGSPTAESLQKRSAALKGRKLSIEHREKLSQSQRGRKRTSPAERAGYERRVEKLKGVPRSPESVANMVKAQRSRSGLPRTDAQKLADSQRSERMKGRVLSQETRSKQSASMKARYTKHPRSTEHSRKLSEAQKGRVFSEETLKKMRESRRRYLECKKVSQKTLV